MQRSRILWEGGNLLCDGQRFLVGVDTLAENRARLGLAHGQILRLLEAEVGCPVVPLGDLERARYDATERAVQESGQAEYHIDLDVALLGPTRPNGPPRALVSDVALGLDHMDAVLAHPQIVRGHFVPEPEARELMAAEYQAFAQQRYPDLMGYAATLEELGYTVTGMPDLRMARSGDIFNRRNMDFGYCNVLPGLHRGRPAVLYLALGLRELDCAAVQCLRAAGVKPVRVSRSPFVANRLMTLRGGLRCFCGSVG